MTADPTVAHKLKKQTKNRTNKQKTQKKSAYRAGVWCLLIVNPLILLFFVLKQLKTAGKQKSDVNGGPPALQRHYNTVAFPKIPASLKRKQNDFEL